jgi:uncharacterized protein (DUF2252 family)
VARGEDARILVPLETHAELTPDKSRDPVGLLLEQEKTRVPELVPTRHGRMLVSPFTYYRGAALPMAADLSTTPASGLRVQLCGDAHLSNFGAFASPERRLVFDVNDFDETLPGPFEWDVKRLAASLTVAGRDNGFSGKACRKIVLAGVEKYRTAMQEFSGQPFMAVWYSHLDVEDTIAQLQSQMPKKERKATAEDVAKAHSHDSMQALRKLATQTDGQWRIISDPPLIEPIEQVFPDEQASAIHQQVREMLGKYQRSLQSDRKYLLQHFTLARVGRKVVGVGSVGTRCWIALMDAGGRTEPLFLQAKEAQTSVLASYLGRSQYANQGERVVAGQHLMQAESDVFLGWTHATGTDGVDRDYYLRQLKDWKFSARIEHMNPSSLESYAGLCGWTLARAHARSGDRIALAAYLGGSGTFDQAIADFAEKYADQNERDYAALQAAVKDGRAKATPEILCIHARAAPGLAPPIHPSDHVVRRSRDLRRLGHVRRRPGAQRRPAHPDQPPLVHGRANLLRRGRRPGGLGTVGIAEPARCPLRFGLRGHVGAGGDVHQGDHADA